MAESRVIKRYANRKLYDTQRSRYVTLEQIAELIRVGEDVKIVDNNTKEDLTSVTLAQIIFEAEKRQKHFLPLGALRNIIQSGGESLQELASHAGARVRSVFRRDVEGQARDGGLLQGPTEESELAPDAPPAKTTDDGSAGPGNALREFLERSQQTFDEWQKRVDERVQKVVEALAPWTGLQKELAELQQRLGDLEKRLSDDASSDSRAEP